MAASSSTISTRISGRFGSFISYLCSLRHREVISPHERDHYVKSRPAARTRAGCPDSPAKRANGIRAPVQSNTEMGFPRLGREAFLKDPLEILRCDPNAIVTAVQYQLPGLALGNHLCTDAQRAPGLSAVSCRVGRVDD